MFEPRLSIRLALEAGQSNEVPILVGSNADEGTIFMNGETYPESLEAYEALLESRYDESAESFSFEVFSDCADVGSACVPRRSRRLPLLLP